MRRRRAGSCESSGSFSSNAGVIGWPVTRLPSRGPSIAVELRTSRRRAGWSMQACSLPSGVCFQRSGTPRLTLPGIIGGGNWWKRRSGGTINCKLGPRGALTASRKTPSSERRKYGTKRSLRLATTRLETAIGLSMRQGECALLLKAIGVWRTSVIVIIDGERSIVLSRRDITPGCHA